MSKPKILFVTNVDWFFISHRLCIAQFAVNNGFDVYVAAEDTGRAKEIEIDGINFINLKFSRSGTNPLNELKTLYDFYQLYSDIKPDVVHHITLKPVIYGSLFARLLNVPGVVNAISGLGYTFTNNRMGFVGKTMIRIMRYGFKRPNISLIFQNADDQQELYKLGAIYAENRIHRIKGSGVDLRKFYHSDLPSFDRIKILLPVRMLWDKGVGELKEASVLLKNIYYNKVQFILAGLADEENKAGVPAQFLKDWEDGEYVKWIGYQKDMVAICQDSHIVVLPSYREGMPKSLIEACAIGRAIVTTDAIGCRECVDEGINGYKVPVKSVNELAEALEKLITSPQDIINMGNESRRKAETEFDVNKVISKHIEIYKECI